MMKNFHLINGGYYELYKEARELKIVFEEATKADINELMRFRIEYMIDDSKLMCIRVDS